MDHREYDIHRIAELARLGLTEDERKRFGTQLADILSYIEKLRPIKTESIPPTDHATGNVNVSRADAVEPSTPADLLREAPNRTYRIPSVRSLWTS